MFGKKLKRLEGKRNYDARETKIQAYVDWYEYNSSWAPPVYKISNEFYAKVQEIDALSENTIKSCNLSSENFNCLDFMVDRFVETELSRLNEVRVRHIHSLQEIHTAKLAKLNDLRQEIAFLEEEVNELEQLN